MRATCPDCLRPLSTCLCALACATANQVPVLILQHPSERLQAKGSARLLHLSLAHCQLEVGEVFEPADLAAWLGAPGEAALLYPLTAAAPAPRPGPAGSTATPNGMSSSTAASSTASTADSATARLVLLDATWRKSLRMLLANPLLLTLPRLGWLEPPQPGRYGRYGVRKAQQPHQLSTLEAACLALAQLEREPARYQPLLAAFEQLLTRSQADPNASSHTSAKTHAHADSQPKP